MQFSPNFVHLPFSPCLVGVLGHVIGCYLPLSLPPSRGACAILAVLMTLFLHLIHFAPFCFSSYPWCFFSVLGSVARSTCLSVAVMYGLLSIFFIPSTWARCWPFSHHFSPYSPITYILFEIMTPGTCSRMSDTYSPNPVVSSFLTTRLWPMKNRLAPAERYHTPAPTLGRFWKKTRLSTGLLTPGTGV